MTNIDLSKLKTALIYDRVNTAYGGAEKVLLALHQLFPQAPLYTSVYDPTVATWAQVFQVKTSFLNLVPLFRSQHRWLVMMMPLAFESLDLSAYDLVISVTSAEAKGIITKPHQLHICYLLTPSRYLYSHRHSYQNQAGWLSWPPVKFLATKLFDYLTWWDQAACQRPDAIIPISHLVSERIKKYYHRSSLPAIYPPIQSIKAPSFRADQLNKFTLPNEYLVVVSRLVSYKRIDLAIKACLKLSKQLIIVGSGPELSNLKKLAGHSGLIHFLGNLDQKDLAQVMNHSAALLMPGIEDFGLTALEVQTLGKPVILHHHSGGAELLKHLVHSIHLEQELVSAMVKAINLLEETSFDKAKLQKNVRKYDRDRFTKELTHQVQRLYQQQTDKESS